MSNIEWKIPGLYKADAAQCYEEITSIGEEVTPQEIVDFARDKNTELHKCFTWDDTKAANNWRKQEARMVSANLVVKYRNKENKTENLRVLVQTEKGRSYTPVTRISRNEDKYAEMLERAKAELTVFKRKYNQVRELEEIIQLINW